MEDKINSLVKQAKLLIISLVLWEIESKEIKQALCVILSDELKVINKKFNYDYVGFLNEEVIPMKLYQIHRSFKKKVYHINK